MAVALRSRPRLVIFDARTQGAEVLGALTRLKADSFTGVIPAAALVGADSAALDAAFRCGADEVLPESLDDAAISIRLGAMLRRSDRDLDVHPSTRLPGAIEIEAEIARRVVADAAVATCYAAPDNFQD